MSDPASTACVFRTPSVRPDGRPVAVAITGPGDSPAGSVFNALASALAPAWVSPSWRASSRRTEDGWRCNRFPTRGRRSRSSSRRGRR